MAESNRFRDQRGKLQAQLNVLKFAISEIAIFWRHQGFLINLYFMSLKFILLSLYPFDIFDNMKLNYMIRTCIVRVV